MIFINRAGVAGRDPRPSPRHRRVAAKAPVRRFIPDTALAGLEERVVPATFTVTSTADSGPGSLRDAIASANTQGGDDTIAFGLAAGSVINLTSGALVINPATPADGLLIDAGTNPVTVDALNNTAGTTPAVNQGIFRIAAADLGSTVIANLVLRNATRPQNAAPPLYGGAIDGNGSGPLTLLNDAFLNDSADYGGAVAYHPANPALGALVVDNCTFGRLVNGSPDASAANRATNQGGAVYYLNTRGLGSFQVSNSNFYGNTATNPAPGAISRPASGGGIYAEDQGATPATSILTSTFVGNRAVGQNGGLGLGGGVSSQGGNAVITVNGTTFTGNVAQGGVGPAGGGAGGTAAGGAAYLLGTSTAVGNTTFNTNTAAAGASVGTGNGITGGNAYGGGLFTAGSALSISNNTTFTSNAITGGAGGTGAGASGAGGAGGSAQGGAFYCQDQSATVFGFFNSNTATGGGGGVGAGTGTGGVGGEADGGAVYSNDNLSLTLAGFFGNVARGGDGAGSGAGGAGGKGGDALGSTIYDQLGSLSLSGSTVLVNLAQGGAGGPGINAPGGAGGEASGATWSDRGYFSVAETVYLKNLSLGGNGGNATASSGVTATAGAGGSAEGAIAGALFLSATSTNFIDNVALGGQGGTGSGTDTGVGHGGPGGQAAGGAIYFNQMGLTLTGFADLITFTGNVVMGGAGGASMTTNGRGGAGGDAAGGALYSNAAHALVSFATFSVTANGPPTSVGNAATGGAGGNYGGGDTATGGTGAGGAALGGAVENAGSMTLGGIIITYSQASGGPGGSVTSAATNVGALGDGGNALGGGISNGGITTPSPPQSADSFDPSKIIIIIINGKAVLIVIPNSPDMISNNTARGGDPGARGGVRGAGLGGGIYNNGTAEVIGTLISGNVADGANGFGGGVFNDVGGTFVLIFDIVRNNSASTTGSALYNLGTTTTSFVQVNGSVFNWPGTTTIISIPTPPGP